MKPRAGPLWPAALLLLLTACVPAFGGAQTVRLALEDDETLSFTPDEAVEDIEIYLEGDDLSLEDEDDCEREGDGWVCRIDRGRPDRTITLGFEGELEAGAAVWQLRNGDKPYALVARASSEDDEETLPLPRSLRERAPDRDDHPWAGDPDFDPSDLDEETRHWYEELEDALDDAPEFRASASSGNLYQVARTLNLHVTPLLLALGETGDLRLLDAVDEAMERAREELKDRWLDGDKDGYLGWLYVRESKEDEAYYGRDNIELDDMMAHGMVAAVTYAYYVNRFRESPAGVDYNERFEFWSDYLINHFEAKWRERTRKRRGFPFVEKELTHAQAGMLRYLHHMGRLGYSRHAEEAERLAEEFADHFKRVDTPGGNAYVFDHGFGDESYGLAPTGYARYTMPVLLELAMTGLEPFDEDFVAPFANTVAYLILDDEPFEANELLAADVGGGIRREGIRPSEFVDEDDRYDSNRLPEFVPFVRFDDSGRIREAVEAVDDSIRDFRVVLAAGMVYALHD